MSVVSRLIVALGMVMAMLAGVSAEETQFKHPKYGGNRLDWCYTFQKGCGQKAANAWCKQEQSYEKATTFKKGENVGKTRTIGDGSVCDDQDCDTFTSITCYRADLPAAVKKYSEPMFKNYRLDWCYAWGKQCGKPAADAFCQLNGHGGAKSYKKDSGVAATRVISNSQVCDGNCDSFKEIVCQ